MGLLSGVHALSASEAVSGACAGYHLQSHRQGLITEIKNATVCRVRTRMIVCLLSVSRVCGIDPACGQHSVGFVLWLDVEVTRDDQRLPSRPYTHQPQRQ